MLIRDDRGICMAICNKPTLYNAYISYITYFPLQCAHMQPLIWVVMCRSEKRIKDFGHVYEHSYVNTVIDGMSFNNLE